MIKKIEIRKLFGRFDYELDLNNESHMTVLTGPNGYGKTTILRLICTLLTESIESIYVYEFKSFKIVTDSKSIIIEKIKNGFKFNDITIALPNFGSIFDDDDKDDMSVSSRRTLRRQRGVYSEKKDADREDEDLSKDNYVGKLYSFICNECDRTTSLDYAKKLKSIRDEIALMKNEIGSIAKINEQRLVEIKDEDLDEPYIFSPNLIKTFVVDENSKDLKRKLDAIMKSYSEISATLDSTYAERLFRDNEVQDKTAEQIEKALGKIKEEQEKLKVYGFPTGDFIIEDEWKDKYAKNAKVLSIYINDMVKKYEVFEDILKKLELYERILNEKLTFKKVELSYKNGIQVFDDKNNSLKLTDLSSGEQNILVLYYRLIFESDANLILVDEPEISLHIAWQDQFIDDLKDIIELKNNKLQVIIATHSIELVLNNTDIQIDLGGLYNEQFCN